MLFATVVIVIGVILWLILKGRPSTQLTTNISPANISTKQIEPQGLHGHYLFHGTTTWSRGVESESKRVDGTYDYAKPFSQLSTFDKNKYDAWFTSFECPITNNVVPFRTQVDNLIFNCRPEFLPEAAKYFDFYDLANNHTSDQGGMTGLAETREHLDKTPGVQYFGNFDPSITDDICEVVALPVRIQKSDKSETKDTVPVALCAWHYFSYQPKAGEIEQMKQYADIMPVFAFAEMGTEYLSYATSVQKEIAHKIIDQGPEFLIANNPHWVQNTEVYKGKLIVYATGNFIFDQLEPEEQRSASIDVTMDVPYDDNVAKWVELAATCKTFQDDCLAKARRQGLTKIEPKLTYGVVAGQGGYKKLTHKADATTQTDVEQRMGWSATLRALGL